MNEYDKIAVEIIQYMELAKQKLERLRADSASGFNARALSVAITELETSQLWVANARPDTF